MNQSPLKGKTALITGAAKRLGRAVALALADAGVNVVIHHSRSAQAAESLRSALLDRGVRAWHVKADFEKPAELESLLERAGAEAGPIDILVNNASIFNPETLDALTLESLARNVEVNAWAPFVLTRAFAQRAARGKVVNVLDAKVAEYDFQHAGYILSKQLLATLTRMTAVALAPRVEVNAVAPGLILPPEDKDESYLARLAKTVPLQRHGDPSDIARAVLFLLESDFITGQVIYVDGGRHLLAEDIWTAS